MILTAVPHPTVQIVRLLNLITEI